MHPVLIGDTTLCSAVDGISSLVRGWVFTVRGTFWPCPNHKVFCHIHTWSCSGHHYWGSSKDPLIWFRYTVYGSPTMSSLKQSIIIIGTSVVRQSILVNYSRVILNTTGYIWICTLGWYLYTSTKWPSGKPISLGTPSDTCSLSSGWK